MTIETEVAALTTSTNALVTAVGVQQTGVNNAVAAIAATTNKVDNELNNVDNTSDIDKPVSTASQTAIGTKQDILVSGDNISTINGVSVLSGTPLVIARAPTSLAALSYDQRGTLTVDPAAPNLPNVVDDSIIIEGIGLFMWVDSLNEPDDDETCFSTPSGQWLLSIPAYDLLDAWDLIETSVLNDLVELDVLHHDHQF